ncbi:MAG TPA: hypothetical protein VHV82_20630 [Sporichthyaceae bacterium]|nr:hypothetical protein [Sporichthyaceae bacterium]
MRSAVQRVRRLYGAHPGHAVMVGAGFLVCALALRPLLAERPVPVAEWFVSGAVLNDAVLLPAYVGLDAALVALWRKRPGRVGWLNFVRVPAAISLLLLVVWYPLVSNRAASFQRATGRTTQAYRGHWLFVTAVLFAASALCFLARVAATRPTRRAPQ